jgi:hypothetical protein
VLVNSFKSPECPGKAGTEQKHPVLAIFWAKKDNSLGEEEKPCKNKKACSPSPQTRPLPSWLQVAT